MIIFVDESGTFTHMPGGTGVSLVGALIIPEDKLDLVVTKYMKLRGQLPTHNGEVKGRLLSESQVDQVVTLLLRNEVLFEAVAVDTGIHAPNSIEAHKLGQAAGLTANKRGQARIYS